MPSKTVTIIIVSIIILLGAGVGALLGVRSKQDRSLERAAGQTEVQTSGQIAAIPLFDEDEDPYYEKFIQSEFFRQLPEEDQYIIQRGGAFLRYQDDLRAAGAWYPVPEERGAQDGSVDLVAITGQWPDTAERGQKVSFDVRVANPGEGKAGVFKNRLYVDDKPVALETVRSLDGFGGRSDFVFVWPAVCGSHTVVFSVDDNFDIIEANEDNNVDPIPPHEIVVKC